MTYQTEFPDFAEGDIPTVFLAPPWRDESWHNEACPSFSRALPSDPERRIFVFVDYVDPAKREFAEGPRYSVRIDDEEDTTFASDSLAAVLDHVGFLAGEVAR